tara:strand:- start:531 stop:680 length:150 start_codon:yes stop_codon:yes gene_type:complete
MESKSMCIIQFDVLDTLLGSKVFAPREKVRIKERRLIVVFINFKLNGIE